MRIMVPSSRMISAAGLQAGDPAEVHGGFGVAVALQDAVRLREKGEHVAGAPEILRAGGIVHAFHGGDGALGGADAGGGSRVVDGDGEGGLMVVRVVHDHLRDLQTLYEFLRHGHADESLSVGRHEVDVLRGGKLRCADEIALVLAVRVVDADDDLSFPEILYSFFNGVHLFHV